MNDEDMNNYFFNTEQSQNQKEERKHLDEKFYTNLSRQQEHFNELFEKAMDINSVDAKSFNVDKYLPKDDYSSSILRKYKKLLNKNNNDEGNNRYVLEHNSISEIPKDTFLDDLKSEDINFNMNNYKEESVCFFNNNVVIENKNNEVNEVNKKAEELGFDIKPPFFKVFFKENIDEAEIENKESNEVIDDIQKFNLEMFNKSKTLLDGVDEAFKDHNWYCLDFNIDGKDVDELEEKFLNFEL